MESAIMKELVKQLKHVIVETNIFEAITIRIQQGMANAGST